GGNIPEHRHKSPLVAGPDTDMKKQHDDNEGRHILRMIRKNPEQYKYKTRKIKPAQVMERPVNHDWSESLHLDEFSIESGVVPVEKRVKQVTTDVPENFCGRPELRGVSNDDVRRVHRHISMFQKSKPEIRILSEIKVPGKVGVRRVETTGR